MPILPIPKTPRFSFGVNGLRWSGRNSGGVVVAGSSPAAPTTFLFRAQSLAKSAEKACPLSIHYFPTISCA